MANTIRQTILDKISAKKNWNGDGAQMKVQDLHQIGVNDFDLAQIRPDLIANNEDFGDHFYNIKEGQWLVWENKSQMFKNMLTGEEYFISLFYDQFDNLVQSALDWTFVDGSMVNVWEFGTDQIDTGKTNGMYISDDGGTTNNYSGGPGNSGVSHATLDQVIPSGSKVKVKVSSKSNGNNADELRFFAYNTPTVPVSDVQQPGVNLEHIVQDEFDFHTFEFELDNTFTDTTMSLSFEWRNNLANEQQVPGHIASVEILFK